ncbi:large ribosomal subunit protein mL54 isoform X3 [Phyllobates terribilis]|uniref:large ribosomal subunit protein mL54 isoform X3 n=1 Tax=Phyllobates terribilis TaxID=111132 RepID=UPI003CCA738F
MADSQGKGECFQRRDYMSRGAVLPWCPGSDKKPEMAGRAALRVVSALISRHGAAQLRGYAKKPVFKGKGKGSIKEVQKGPEVCKDPAILMTHAMGVNIYKSGSDIKLKDDSQYPEWMGRLRPDVLSWRVLETELPAFSAGFGTA